ncbi:MAG: BlaI/MecI/CopY family transcriptional regulator [Acidobacteria bacterium]|nr:BlaI/MecI/CopY family transcriptional regulator [Acidobacteriota bacterium]
MRNTTESNNLADLGDLEREVMDLVWQYGPCTAEDVRSRIGRRLKESTIRTVLRRLEEKNYVTHTVDTRTFIYAAAESRGKVAARGVRRLMDWFCNGSVEELLVGMVDSSVLDKKELKRLAGKIAKAKGGK